MKEDMLEVLIYLFENYIVDGLSFEPSHDDLAKELEGAGFGGEEIGKAFVWLEDLMDICEQGEHRKSTQDEEGERRFFGGGTNTESSPTAHRPQHLLRFYTDQERIRLDIDAQSLLYRLVNVGVLDLFSRETVIDRVMALDSEFINLDHIKWVVLMVLSNQPGFAEIAEWAEVVVSEDLVPAIH